MLGWLFQMNETKTDTTEKVANVTIEKVDLELALTQPSWAQNGGIVAEAIKRATGRPLYSLGTTTAIFDDAQKTPFAFKDPENKIGDLQATFDYMALCKKEPAVITEKLSGAFPLAFQITWTPKQPMKV